MKHKTNRSLRYVNILNQNKRNYLSNNLERSVSSLFGVHCELCGLSNSQTTALEARTIRLNLKWPSSVRNSQGRSSLFQSMSLGVCLLCQGRSLSLER